MNRTKKNVNAKKSNRPKPSETPTSTKPVERDRRILTHETAMWMAELFFLAFVMYIFGTLATIIAAKVGIAHLIGMCIGFMAYKFAKAEVEKEKE